MFPVRTSNPVDVLLHDSCVLCRAAVRYKVHTSRDIITWQSGAQLTWRNFENSCPTAWNAKPQTPAAAGPVDDSRVRSCSHGTVLE